MARVRTRGCARGCGGAWKPSPPSSRSHPKSSFFLGLRGGARRNFGLQEPSWHPSHAGWRIKPNIFSPSIEVGGHQEEWGATSPAPPCRMKTPFWGLEVSTPLSPDGGAGCGGGAPSPLCPPPKKDETLPKPRARRRCRRGARGQEGAPGDKPSGVTPNPTQIFAWGGGGGQRGHPPSCPLPSQSDGEGDGGVWGGAPRSPPRSFQRCGWIFLVSPPLK